MFGLTSLLFDNFSLFKILIALSANAGQTTNVSNLIGLNSPLVSLCLAACVLTVDKEVFANVGLFVINVPSVALNKHLASCPIGVTVSHILST